MEGYYEIADVALPTGAEVPLDCFVTTAAIWRIINQSHTEYMACMWLGMLSVYPLHALVLNLNSEFEGQNALASTEQ
jgi:hypothetical protein